ncbi:MAG: hypothetical protein JWO12_1497 [Frankiales bacterium]|nr:hypothetical protein [Frankiales bacterium]
MSLLALAAPAFLPQTCGFAAAASRPTCQAPHPVYLAHAFGARYELPIPLFLFVVGGALVVVLSFMLVLRTPGGSAPEIPAEDAVPSLPFGRVSGPLSILLTALVALVGLTGSQEIPENIAPETFWVFVWIGVPLSCGLLGDWTRPFNAFANLGRLGDSTRLRKLVLARTEPLPWRVGWWPAVALFVLLVLGELVFNLHTTVPAFVGGALLAYGVLSLFLGLLFGQGWLARGEVFSGLFNAWGRLGYFRFGAPGRRRFTGGLDVPFEASASRVVFVLLLLVSINFDGLLATPQWASYERRTLGVDTSGIDLLRTGSLLVLVAVVLAVFVAFATASARAGRDTASPVAALARLLPSLVPIAFGYLIAHYLQYLLTNGQLIVPLIGNPGYTGWPIHLPDPFNDSFEINRTLLPNSFYWYLSVIVIVAVHVIAVILAHRALLQRATDEHSARRSEYPWLIAMVAYTAFSLFLIAQPLTQEKNTATTEGAGTPTPHSLIRAGTAPSGP